MAKSNGTGEGKAMDWSAKHPVGSKKAQGSRKGLSAASTNKTPKQAATKSKAGTSLKSKTGQGKAQHASGWKTAIQGLKGINTAKSNGLGKAGKGLRITDKTKLFKD